MSVDSDSSFTYEVYKNSRRIAYEDYFETPEDAKAALIEHLKSLKSVHENCEGSVYKRYSDGEWGDGICYTWNGSKLELLGPAY